MASLKKAPKWVEDANLEDIWGKGIWQMKNKCKGPVISVILWGMTGRTVENKGRVYSGHGIE